MAFPTMIGEVLLDPTGERAFPFRSWAAKTGFVYPESAESFYCQCGSAAEAFFVRAFIAHHFGEGIKYPKVNLAVADALTFELQARCANYSIDALVGDGKSSLAIEIDGVAYHHRSQDQIADDCLRQRRIVLKGHTVIRFTAREVFRGAPECWRQVMEILAARAL
jgi:very-short-patch-repair endonuclease